MRSKHGMQQRMSVPAKNEELLSAVRLQEDGRVEGAGQALEQERRVLVALSDAAKSVMNGGQHAQHAELWKRLDDLHSSAGPELQTLKHMKQMRGCQ